MFTLIKLRGHHIERLAMDIPLVCSGEFQGGCYLASILGYDKEFIEYREDLYQRKFRENPKILVVGGLADDLCQNCISAKGSSLCCGNDDRCDEGPLSKYEFKVGAVYTVEEILKKLHVEKRIIEEYLRVPSQSLSRSGTT